MSNESTKISVLVMIKILLSVPPVSSCAMEKSARPTAMKEQFAVD